MPEHHDRRTTETRRLILLEAEKLYYIGGYENINLQVIADRLNITKAALFHHFKKKQALFFAMLMVLLEHMQQVFAVEIENGEATVRARLSRLMFRLAGEPNFDMMRFQREELGLLEPEQQQEIRHAWNTGPFATVERIFREGVENGELREHDVTLAAYLFLHTCLLLPRPENPVHSTIKYTDQREYVVNVLGMLLDGLVRQGT